MRERDFKKLKKGAQEKKIKGKVINYAECC